MINYDDFLKVEMRIGKIIKVEEFPKARNSAYKLEIDFGKDIGIKKSSAQITKLYSREELIGRNIIGVINFPPKQVADFISEVLVLGVVLDNGEVPLLQVDRDVPLGMRIS